MLKYLVQPRLSPLGLVVLMTAVILTQGAPLWAFLMVIFMAATLMYVTETLIIAHLIRKRRDK